MRQLVEGDRVEVDVSRRLSIQGIVRGTISFVDDPKQGVESCCYYIEFDEPISVRQEGRYEFSTGRAEPVYHITRELCVNHKERCFRLLSILELLAEAAQ